MPGPPPLSAPPASAPLLLIGLACPYQVVGPIDHPASSPPLLLVSGSWHLPGTPLADIVFTSSSSSQHRCCPFSLHHSLTISPSSHQPRPLAGVSGEALGIREHTCNFNKIILCLCIVPSRGCIFFISFTKDSVSPPSPPKKWWKPLAIIQDGKLLLASPPLSRILVPDS